MSFGFSRLAHRQNQSLVLLETDATTSRADQLAINEPRLEYFSALTRHFLRGCNARVRVESETETGETRITRA